MKAKPYKAKTISGAQAYVRMLLKQRRELNEMIGRIAKERKLMAMLAADGPCFESPMLAATVKQLRDNILREECRLNPDGTPLR